MNRFSFITLGECPHLDNKHSVFGEVVGGIPTLDIFNKIDKDDNERPMVVFKRNNFSIFSLLQLLQKFLTTAIFFFFFNLDYIFFS